MKKIGLLYDSMGKASIVDIVGEETMTFTTSHYDEVQIPKSIANKIKTLQKELRNLQGHSRSSSEYTRSAQINRELGSLVASFDPDAVESYNENAVRLDDIASRK